VTYHPTENIIATASDDRTIKLINRQGKLLTTWKGKQTGVLGLDYHPNGSSLVSGHNDGTVRLWEISTTEPTKIVKVTTLTDHDALVWRIAYSPNGSVFATASEDNTVKIWDRQGKLLRVMRMEFAMLLLVPTVS